MPRSRCFVATNSDCNTCADIDTYGHSPLRNHVIERKILKLATFVGPTSRTKPIRSAASVVRPMQFRRFAAICSTSGPRFCEECSEVIDRTPFGRCTRELGSASPRLSTARIAPLAPLSSTQSGLVRNVGRDYRLHREKRRSHLAKSVGECLIALRSTKEPHPSESEHHRRPRPPTRWLILSVRSPRFALNLHDRGERRSLCQTWPASTSTHRLCA